MSSSRCGTLLPLSMFGSFYKRAARELLVCGRPVVELSCASPAVAQPAVSWKPVWCGGSDDRLVPVKPMNTAERWGKHFPRKPRAKGCGKAVPAQQLSSVPRPKRLRLRGPAMHAAAAPAELL